MSHYNLKGSDEHPNTQTTSKQCDAFRAEKCSESNELFKHLRTKYSFGNYYKKIPVESAYFWEYQMDF